MTEKYLRKNYIFNCYYMRKEQKSHYKDNI